HDGLAVVSHPLRQMRRTVPKATGKLCAMPVHPLSRSVPTWAMVRANSRGPPFGLAGHSGTHRSTRRSTSFLGFALARAVIASLSGFEGFAPPLVCSRLSLTRLAAPHAGAAWSGGSWSPSFCADFESLTA